MRAQTARETRYQGEGEEYDERHGSKIGPAK
jgi:hypothetical protein